MENLAVDRRAGRAREQPRMDRRFGGSRAAGRRQRQPRARSPMRKQEGTQRNSPRGMMVRRCNDAGSTVSKIPCRLLRLGLPALAGRFYPEACRRSAGSSAMRRSSTRSRSTQLLPPAARLDLRQMARAGAARLPLCGQGQPLHHPHEEAARLRGGDRPVHRPRPPARRRSLARSSTSCRRASSTNLERLEGFLTRLPKDLEQVIEFRHRSWYDEDILALLDRHGVGFVTHDAGTT